MAYCHLQGGLGPYPARLPVHDQKASALRRGPIAGPGVAVSPGDHDILRLLDLKAVLLQKGQGCPHLAVILARVGIARQRQGYRLVRLCASARRLLPPPIRLPKGLADGLLQDGADDGLLQGLALQGLRRFGNRGLCRFSGRARRPGRQPGVVLSKTPSRMVVTLS